MDVSFSMNRGESLAVVGKSTLARLLTHIEKPSAGTFIFNHQEVTHLSRQQFRAFCRQVQMVFQTPVESFDLRKTLGNGIMEGMRNFGWSEVEARVQMDDLLCKVDLDKSFASKYPAQVSGGQCQRAAIARAVACRPQLLICDEATSALDMIVQLQIVLLLKKLQKEYSMALLFICHDLTLIPLVCEKILVMKDGTVIESGRVKEVMIKPNRTILEFWWNWHSQIGDVLKICLRTII